jgi:hypothetical protein
MSSSVKDTRKWNEGYLSLVHCTLYSWAYTWRECAGHKRFGECYWFLLILVPKCLFYYIPTLFIFLFITSIIALDANIWKQNLVTTWLWCPVIFYIHQSSSSLSTIPFPPPSWSLSSTLLCRVRGSHLIWGRFCKLLLNLGKCCKLFKTQQ